MNQTAVSIVVPVYHSGQYLEDCLSSLKNQDFALPFQVIMVDCGGDSFVAEMAKEWEKKDPRFFYFRTEKNLGPGFSRNLGLFFSSGKYVSFVDGDDVLSPDFLSVLYQKAEETKAEMVTSGYYLFDGKKKRKGYSRSGKTLSGKKVLRKIYLSPCLKYRTFCWGRLYRRDFLMKNRILFDTSLMMFEDWYFMNVVFLEAKKAVFIKKCLYGYRQHQGSIMSTHKNRFEFHCEAITKSKGYIQKKDRKLAERLFSHLSFPLRIQLGFDLRMEKRKKERKLKEFAQSLERK